MGTRRLAAVAVVDVVGYSTMMSEDEDGTLAAWQGHRRAVDPVWVGRGGRIVKGTGDGLLVEVPSAVEAVRAAVEVQQLMRSRNAEMPVLERMLLRIGVHVGEVVVEGDGDIYGDVVNVAARLEGRAHAGGVCVSDDVHRQVIGRVEYDFDDLGRLSVKNIPHPVAAWQVRLDVPVGQPSPDGARGLPARQGEGPLVGREREVVALGAELERTWSWSTRCVVLGGEAGIGKTRLAGALAEVASEADPAGRVVWGQCVDLGADGIPYAPFLPVLRALATDMGGQRLGEVLGPGRAELARLLPELGAAAAIEPEVGRGRLFEAAARLLEQCAAARPLVVVLEDLHWADASSRELLEFLVRNVEETRVLLVVTYRSDEIHRRHPLRPLLGELGRSPRVTRLSIERLESSDVESMLTYRRGQPPDPRLLADVFERTGGLPFFVEELAAREPGQELPDTLRDLLLLRVEALSEPGRGMLAAASVGGLRVVHDDLAAVTGLDPRGLDAALKEAVGAQLLRVDRDLHGYAFRHALLREAVYDDLLPGEQTSLHERWAGVLQQRLDEDATDAGLAVQVAHHWYAALDLPRAFSASLTAADAAQAAHAPQEEMQMLERALQLWARVTNAESVAGCDRAALLERAADAAFDAGDDDRQDTFSTAALAAVDPDSHPQRHAHLLSRHLGHSHSLSAEEFLAAMDSALEAMPPDTPSADRAWALWKLAQWHHMLGHVVAADLAAQARAEAQRVSDREVESFAVGILAFAQAVAGWGELDTGLGLLEEARLLAVEAGSERAHMFYRLSLSELLMIMGRFDEARQVCVEGRERVQRYGLIRTYAKIWAVNEAAALVALGHWDEAVALAEHLLAQDLPHFSELALSHLRAEVLTYRGDPQAPDAVAALDRVTAWTGNDPRHTFPVAMVRAEHALALGDTDGALSTLLDTLTDLGRPLAYTAWAMLHTLARTISTIEQGGDVQHHARDTLAHARQSFTHSGIQQVWDAVIDAELTPGTDDTAADRWRPHIGSSPTQPSRARPTCAPTPPTGSVLPSSPLTAETTPSLCSPLPSTRPAHCAQPP